MTVIQASSTLFVQPTGSGSPASSSATDKSVTYCEGSASLQSKKLNAIDSTFFSEMKTLVQTGTLKDIQAALPKLRQLYYAPIEDAILAKRHDVAQMLFKNGLPVSRLSMRKISLYNWFDLFELFMQDPRTVPDGTCHLAHAANTRPELIGLLTQVLERSRSLSDKLLQQAQTLELTKLLIKYNPPIGNGNYLGYVDNVEAIRLKMEYGVRATSHDMRLICMDRKGPEWMSLIKDMLDTGAPVDDITLGLAIEKNNLDLVALLMQRKVPTGAGAIRSAVEIKDLDLVDRLIDYGAPLTDESYYYAILDGDWEMIEELLSRGAPLGSKVLEPILWSSAKPHSSVFLQRFLSLGCPVTSEVLKEGLNHNNIETVELLLSKADRVSPECYVGLALRKDRSTVIELAEKLYARESCPSAYSLRIACIHGQEDLVKWMLDHGVEKGDLTLGDAFRWSPMIRDLLISHLDLPITINDLMEVKSAEECLFFTNVIFNLLPQDLQSPKTRDEVMRLIKIFQNYDAEKVNIRSRRTIGPALELISWVVNTLKNYEKNGFTLEELALINLGNVVFAWQMMHCNFSLHEDVVRYSPYGFNPKLYEELLPHIQNDYKIEGNQGAESTAYKLATLFDRADEAFSYLESYKMKHPKSKQPVHDACLFELPMRGLWSISQWRSILKRENYSKKWMQLLPLVPAIELSVSADLTSIFELKEKFSEEWSDRGSIPRKIQLFYKKELQKKTGHKGGPKLWEGTKALLPDEYEAFINKKVLMQKKVKLSRKALEAALNKRPPVMEFIDFLVRYRDITKQSYRSLVKRATRAIYSDVQEKYIPFAFECVKHGVGREFFNEIISILEKTPKEQDYVPDVRIPGELAGFPGYVIEKMSPRDPLVFILGKLTGCCQSIDGHSRNCVLHGAQSPFGGFVRIMKPGSTNKWVAQSWVGMTEDNELVFDSIEWNKGFDTKKIMELYALASTDILDCNPHIHRILFGGGGNTPRDHKFPLFMQRPYSRIIGYENTGYDSESSRYLLADRDDLNPERLALVRSIDHTSLKEGPRSEVTEDGLTVAEGRDTYVNPDCDTKIRDLTLDTSKRIEFFRQHPLTHEMLWKNEKNPLMEEGYIKDNSREYFGEPFLTLESAEILIPEKLKAKGVEVNHYIFVDNDEHDLQQKLKDIEIKEGESAIIGYCQGVHTVGVYLQRINGQLIAAYIDSESGDFVLGRNQCCKILLKTWPDIKLIRFDQTLQRDYYSCTTFACKGLLYFAKKGKEALVELAEAATEKGGDGSYVLSADKIPADLLKYSQYPLFPEGSDHDKSHITLPVELFEGLSHGWRSNQVDLSGRSYNAGLLRKKLRYIDYLEGCLNLSKTGSD
jgi:hypothetical protein